MSTPVPLSPTSTAAPAPAPSLPARVAGVLRSPRAAFAAVTRLPRPAGVLVLTFVVMFVVTAALLQTEVGRLALVDQWERTALAFGQPVDDARYAAFQRASDHPLPYAALRAIAAGPLLAFATSGLLFAVFNGMRRGAARYRQVLAIAAHAAVILALRDVVAAPINYARETLGSPATLRLLFTMTDEGSPLARFSSFVDLFVIWWAAAIALGMAGLYRRPARPLVLAFVGGYVVLAGILALIVALSGGAA